MPTLKAAIDLATSLQEEISQLGAEEQAEKTLYLLMQNNDVILATTSRVAAAYRCRTAPIRNILITRVMHYGFNQWHSFIEAIKPEDLALEDS